MIATAHAEFDSMAGRSTLAPTAFEVPKTQISIFQQTYARPVINDREELLRAASIDAISKSKRNADGTKRKRFGHSIEAQAIVSGFGAQELSPNLYLEAPEAMVDYDLVKLKSFDLDLELGRAKHDWSRLDSNWALGLWQSRSRWDYLSTRPVGLEGAFLSAKSARWEILLFASYLYIPERGPDLTLKDGKFTATQFGPSVPDSEGNAFSPTVTTPYRYRIDMPSYADLVLQPSIGTQVAYQGDKGVFVRAAIADKPIRQIQLSFNAVNDIDLGAQLAQVDVVPHVDRHTIAAIDAGYKFHQTELGLSVLGERPRQKEIASNRTHSVLTESLLTGASASVGLAAIGLKRWSLNGGYLKRFGGDLHLEGVLASSAGTTVEQRHMYREAVSLGLDVGNDIRSPLRIRSRVIQELTADATWISLNVRALTFNSHLGILLGVDLLASEQRSDDFITKMKAGDRLTGGVSYVF